MLLEPPDQPFIMNELAWVVAVVKLRDETEVPGVDAVVAPPQRTAATCVRCPPQKETEQGTCSRWDVPDGASLRQ